MSIAPTYDERELILKIAKGDERAFSQLLHKYGETIYAQALAYAKSVEIAEELTQDVFLKVWQRRDKLAEVEHFDKWLFIVARNLIFDSFKKAVHQAVEPFPEPPASNNYSPDHHTEFRETYQIFLEGVSLLPEKRQQVFRMSRLEGLTHEEIAKRLGINKITVAQYIVLSLNFLKSYLNMRTSGGTLAIVILLRGWM